MSHDTCIARVEFDYDIVGETHYDADPLNPRKDYDQVATMVCWHRRYNLGDEQPDDSPANYFRQLVDDVCPSCDGAGEDDDGNECAACGGEGAISDEDVMNLFSKSHYILPLYLYDHSGITMSTGRFSVPWDSGQVGWIYVSHERAHSERGTHEMLLVKPASLGPSGYIPATYNKGRPLTEQDYLECLKGEVEEYDAYLTGQVFGYVIKNIDGDVLDSCWGFIGDEEAAEQEMRSMAAHHVQEAAREEKEVDYWAARDVVTV